MSNGIKLYSFDVFDTLITRKTATCNGIFAIMQKELCCNDVYRDFPEHLKGNFSLMRIQAENVARFTYLDNRTRDITLRQIYQGMQETIGLSDRQAELLYQLEIDTEFSNAVPIKENIEKVKSLAFEGGRVILISNMYLPQQVIKRMLIKADPVFERIPVYVSSECGKVKDDGQLYRYVQRHENVGFSEWKHFGDNKKLDWNIPLSLGMEAELSGKLDFLPWEKECIEHHECNVSVQTAIAPSRYLLRQGHCPYPYAVGSGYGGPILYPYVSWVLEQSLAKGIETLFFIARDGYILKGMSDIIIAEKNLPIRTKYLYGSRKAWRLPSITKDTFDMKEFLVWNYADHVYSYQGMADIFGFTVEELRLFLPFVTDGELEISKKLAEKCFHILEDAQEDIAEYIHQKQENERKSVQAYLWQELKQVNGQYAFVDLIGSGYTQKCLADLLPEAGNIITFFYRLDSCMTRHRNTNYSFYPNRQRLGNIIEVLCCAGHGQTNSYKWLEGKWRPVLGEDERQELERHGFPDYLKGLMDYTKVRVGFESPHLGQANTATYASYDSLRILDVYISFLSEGRDRRLYDFLSDMPYGATGRERRGSSFAPKLSEKELRQIYLTHSDEPVSKFYEGESLQFSLLRLSRGQKRRVLFYQKLSHQPIGRRIRDFAAFISHVKKITHDYCLIANKVVIYGAGEKGRLLYRQLTEGKQYHVEVVLWVDRNYGEYQKEGLKVSPLEAINGVEYEQIVIAVAKEEMAIEMKEELIKRQIKAHKIIWISPR